MVDDFGSEKIETDGPIEGQQEKDAIADAIARGAQTAPEDQSRSTLHTGELQEGAVLNKPGQRGAAHFSEEPLRLEAQEVIAQTRRDPNIIETDAAPSEEQTAPVSAPLPQNDRGAIAPQNTVYPARNESGQADRFEDVSPANFRAAPVTAPSEITSNLAEDTRNTPEDDNETNHAPDGLTLSDTTVSEQQAGAVIGRLTVQDLNQNDTHSYTVSDDRFEVVDGALKLKDGIALDHEAAAQVDVEVTVTDAAGSAYTESFMINVTDTNDAVTGLTLETQTVAENARGAVVGQLTVADQDVADTHSYTVSDDRFEVVDGALKLKDGIALDHEAAAQVDVEVTVTDAAGSAYTESFMINVTDTNDAVTGLTLETQTVAENARGAVVGQLTVADQDVADTHS
ncbi:cadherin repeat domain-containing protein, partial [Shimia sp. R9_2]|uniref:cadherin repeat domain-containing protein n=1 Tax=Shimia sp. R9_2 TaxID=2821112 RepID=UPI001ADB8258